MKNFSTKSAIGSGVGVTVFFIIKDLLMFNEYSFRSILISIITALITGIIAGLLFGFISARMKPSN